jgi:hypothetical protein
MKLYKLTNAEGKTRPEQYNECQWGPGVTHCGTGKGNLCSEGFIHAYEHPLLAVLLNSIHGNYENPILWECEGEVALREGQLKCGCVELTTVRHVELPVVTIEQSLKFGILCILEVCQKPQFVEWANKWLSGEDRTEYTATITSRDIWKMVLGSMNSSSILAAAELVSAAARTNTNWVAIAVQTACSSSYIDLIKNAKLAIGELA